jgi:hypothetical protein
VFAGHSTADAWLRHGYSLSQVQALTFSRCGATPDIKTRTLMTGSRSPGTPSSSTSTHRPSRRLRREHPVHRGLGCGGSAVRAAGLRGVRGDGGLVQVPAPSLWGVDVEHGAR